MIKKRLLSLLVLLAAVVTGAWAETITWDNTNVFKSENAGVTIGSELPSATYEGITITYNNVTGYSYLMLCPPYGPQAGRLHLEGASDDSFTFTAPTGKIFTKIEINGQVSTFTPYGDWTKPSDQQIAWSGTAVNTVTLGSVNTSLPAVGSIVFYVDEPLPGYTVTLAEGTEDAANWSATPSQATEGQTVTINYAGTKSVKSVTAKRKATTGNITVYFTDAKNWGDVHVYYWNDGPDWPGTAMTEVGTNEYSQKVYRAEIPATAVGIIFNGNGRQTVDITENIADGSWWYTTEGTDGSGHNYVSYNNKYTENIVVTNVDANNWTFTQPDGNVELDIEYYPAHPVTISDGDVDAANWSATPTEQSVGQNVTLQYTGRKKIKRITIEAAPTGPTAYTLAESTVGMIVGSDGKAYAAADKDNLPSGVTAVAMVAYKSGSNGLAIQLNGSPVEKEWDEAKTYAVGLTAVSGGTWRLPSMEDWQNMFVGCAVSGDASASDEMNPIAGFKAKIAATGITWKSVYYWSSTESGMGAWSVLVSLGDSNAAAYFDQHATSSERNVLGCLAF